MQEFPRSFPITVGPEPIQARSHRHSNIAIPSPVYRPGGYGHYGEIPCHSEVWEYLGVSPKAAQKEVELFAANSSKAQKNPYVLARDHEAIPARAAPGGSSPVHGRDGRRGG